jgi:hypothetical protein
MIDVCLRYFLTKKIWLVSISKSGILWRESLDCESKRVFGYLDDNARAQGCRGVFETFSSRQAHGLFLGVIRSGLNKNEFNNIRLERL